jgi:hypothetical protein
MTKRQAITPSRVREAIDYDPETGICTRRYDPSKPKEWNTRWASKRAGKVDPKGYRVICIDYVDIEEHRIIWAWMTGEWPVATVDHENLDKSDNRWNNLREATKSEQQHNRAARKDNATGLKGVTALKNGRFMARRGQIFLGNFIDAQEAHEAYCKYAKEHHGAFFRKS